MNTSNKTSKTRLPLIVGINGIANAGKDTIASMVTLSLKDNCNLSVKTFAFADRLKKACSVLFGVPLEHFHDRQVKEVKIPYWNMSPRQMAQKMGTEACRYGIRDDIWIKAINQEILESGVDVAFITDVRFDNEAEYVHGKSLETVGSQIHLHNTNPGIVVNITRSNQTKIADSAHASEQGIDEKHIDWKIENQQGNPFFAAGELQRIILDELKERGVSP